MRKSYLLGVAAAALIAPSAGFAQSTGTIDAEEDIVVTGQAGLPEVNGIQTPEQPKAKAVITQELIERRQPGQSILDTINLIPGVSFTNSDAYGSSGGQIRIRGFDGNRISLTFDGIPLNDSGNYAIYSNQQLDPELIEQVNVNFGATDVDSPTASAAGGTVNYRSLVPSEELGATAVFSGGTNDFTRAFVLLQTGNLTSFGTRAWVSASTTRYEQFRGPGEINKQQFNGKIYQPINSNGDFISVAGHYNENRNNFYSNPTLANIATQVGAGVIPTTFNPANPFTLDLTNDQFDSVIDSNNPAFTYDRGCTLASAAAPVGNNTSQNDRLSGGNNNTSCANVYATARNPSNTGNIRLNSRYTISDKLTFTLDGAYQYTKANGGGTNVLAERDANAFTRNATTGVLTPASQVYANQLGRLGAGVAAGVDINRDGDTLDYVRVYFPSNTRTQRFTAITGLRYDLDEDNAIRVAYTWDRARHRQTGEASLLQVNGQPFINFGTYRDADNLNEYVVTDAAGNPFQKRDRLSYAILHQVSAEYRGQFFEDALKVALGVRAPFFRRNLNNFCYTIPGSSNDAYCTSQTAAQVAASPTTAAYGAPYERRVETYDAVLPNVGFTYNFTPDASMFGSYAKGFSAPRTDNLYGFDDVRITPVSAVLPEKTDSFDLGLRYNSRLIQAQLAGWYIKYNNRIISTLVELEGGGTQNLDRNVGAVETKGIDFNVGIRPVQPLQLYGFVSYIDSELLEDAVNPLTGAVLVATRGKQVVETPEWTYGGRAQVDFDPVSIGIQAKHTGERWITDVNDVKSAGYTLVDLDARIGLDFAGINRTFVQLNINNLLNERYFGNLPTGTTGNTGLRPAFGAPRTFVGSLHVEF
jgi:iron complex outermembrane recepter protein